MTSPRCIKTGCALRLPEGVYYWGDMHLHGTIAIFIAACSADGQPIEQPARDLTASTPVFAIEPGKEWWTRRGIFAMNFADLELSSSLEAYFKEWPL